MNGKTKRWFGRITAVLLASAMLSCGSMAENRHVLGNGTYLLIVNAVENEISASDFVYEDNGDGTIRITKYNGSETEIVIPSKIDGKRVKNLAAGILPYNNKITDIIISDGITEIGYRAFAECSNLKRVTIPESVEKIDEAAFTNCKKLEAVNLPGKINCISKQAFYQCESLKEIAIPSSVKSIGFQSFQGCYVLEKVSLTEGLEEINDMVFSGSIIKNIKIPASVKKI